MSEPKAEVKAGDIERVLLEDRVEGLTLVLLYKNGTAKQLPANAELLAKIAASSVTVTEVVNFSEADL